MSLRRTVRLTLAPALLLLCTLGITASCARDATSSEDNAKPLDPALTQQAIEEILSQAKRIPNSTEWFEILALPNDVYALWEPGHAEKVNSFLILGRDKDVLYDTGMGIASIGQAIADLRAETGLAAKPLMVINSHNHLDHNGGNRDFEEAWIIEDPWAIEKLTTGIPAGGFFTAYWADLSEHGGVTAPSAFDPATFFIPPFDRERIRFLKDGDVVDLGDRRFRVIHTISHSPDGLALHDEENDLLFGGDTFLGDDFLIRDLILLERDLNLASHLDVRWHYSSHGPQLIEAMGSRRRLAVVRRMLAGERHESETMFAGQTFPLYELDGVRVTLAADFLVY